MRQRKKKWFIKRFHADDKLSENLVNSTSSVVLMGRRAWINNLLAPHSNHSQIIHESSWDLFKRSTWDAVEIYRESLKSIFAVLLLLLRIRNSNAIKIRAFSFRVVQQCIATFILRFCCDSNRFFFLRRKIFKRCENATKASERMNAKARASSGNHNDVDSLANSFRATLNCSREWNQKSHCTPC